MIYKLVRLLLPHGVAVLRERKGRLRELGIDGNPSRLLRSGRIIQSAISSRLCLCSGAELQSLKYVVDVGANRGDWTRSVLDLVSPKRILTVEPELKTFRLLEQRYQNEAAVSLVNCAIGDSRGSIRFNVTSDTTGASILQPKPEMNTLVDNNWKVEETPEVPLETLDWLLADWERVDLLKIDVQGFEIQALRGAESILKKTRLLLIELNFLPQYEGGAEVGAVHDLLTGSLGFQLRNLSAPLVIGGRVAMADGLYINPRFAAVPGGTKT